MAQSKDANLCRSILMGSEVEYDFPCHPCSCVGRNADAGGYCMDCGIYLCSQCIRYHTTLPVTAHHQVVDKNQMPTKRDAPAAKIICTERCQIHKDKVIEYFCPAHKFLGCSACITLKHAMCQDVEYIPEAAAGLENKADYKCFKKRLDDLIEKSKDTIQYGQDSLKRATDNYDKVIQEIEAYQQEVNETLDKLKHDIRERAVQIRDTDFGVMNSITDEGNEVLAELKSMSKVIKEQLSKKRYSQMFIQIKTTGDKLTELEERLAGLINTSISIYEFKKNIELQKMLESNDGFGMIVLRKSREIHASHMARWERKETSDIVATHLADINVKSPSNKVKCRISAATLLSPSHLVITDHTNNTVKVVDVGTKMILSELKTESSPWTVTKIDDERLAVSLPYAKKILLLRFDKANGLAADKEIKVKSECWCIAYTQNKLVVSFYGPADVRILSMNGNVEHTFATDNEGKQLFKNPGHVAISTQLRCIYVSEWNHRCVTMLGMNGKVEAVYKDDELDTPRQLTVDLMGRLYVCGQESNNIHLLAADCKKVKVLLRETDGLFGPTGICYCEATHRLYVGMFNDNVVKVYQLNEA